MAGNEVRFDIVATDKASKQLDQVADEAAKLEKADPTVTVDADTRRADRDVDTFAAQLDRLTDADKLVVLAVRAGNAQSELSDLAVTLATIDSSDPDVQIKVDRYAEVADELDQLETKMKEIGSTSIDPDVGGAATARLEGIREEAGKTQDTVHSMAGNAIGDFAATATGVGPLGEALGQLTEAATGGEASMKQLVTAGLGLGAISGGILLVNQLLGHFQDEAKKTAQIKAFNAENVKSFTDAVLAAQDALAKLDKTDLTGLSPRVADLKTKTDELVASWQKAGQVNLFDPVTQSMTDMLPLLVKAGISADQFAKAIEGDQSAVLSLAGSIGHHNVTLAEQQEIYKTLNAAQANYRDGTDDAASRTKFFTTTVDAATDTQRGLNAETDRWAAIGRRYADQAKATRDVLADFGTTADNVSRQFQNLSDEVSQDQSMLQLANELDGVTEAGNNAMQAQIDANKAIKDHAKDATDKQHEATQAARDYQSQIDDLKQHIIELGQKAGATPVEVAATLKKIDDGDLEGAKRDAESWFKTNPVTVAAQLKLIAGLKGLAGLTSTGVTGTSVVNVTQVLPRGWHGDALGEAQAQARRSGGLYQRARR